MASFSKAIFLNILIITLCLAIQTKTNASFGAVKLLNNYSESLYQDTIPVFRGKIVDSATNNPIPFATMKFYTDSGILNIVSDAKGEFSVNRKLSKLQILLSAIGYQQHNCYLVANENNILRLTPESNSLSDVTVTSQVDKNADWLIKKVIKNLAKNYGDFSFDQIFKTRYSGCNYDSLKIETKDSANFNIDVGQPSDYAKYWSSDTLTYDTAFFYQIGVPELYIYSLEIDIIRMKKILDKKKMENFNYKLLSKHKDKYGMIYLVEFEPKNSGYDVFRAEYLGGVYGYFKGEMLINGKDYSVLTFKYTFQQNADSAASFVRKQYRIPAWRSGDKIGRIVPSSIVSRFEYTYKKNPKIGKYFVQTISADCYENGYQIETNQNVQLYYQADANSIGLKNIKEQEE